MFFFEILALLIELKAYLRYFLINFLLKLQTIYWNLQNKLLQFSYRDIAFRHSEVILSQ